MANAVAYLHHGLSKTIIHGNINPRSVFVDQNYVAKLSDFQDALPIPEGEAHVDEEVIRTFGFVAPERAENAVVEHSMNSFPMCHLFCSNPKFDPEKSSDGRYKEKNDVYGFGVLLLEVLTGERLYNSFFWPSETSCERISAFSTLNTCNSSSNSSGRSDICSQEGENRKPVSSSAQPYDCSREIVQECYVFTLRRKRKCG